MGKGKWKLRTKNTTVTHQMIQILGKIAPCSYQPIGKTGSNENSNT
jgi:hypothetical protein